MKMSKYKEAVKARKGKKMPKESAYKKAVKARKSKKYDGSMPVGDYLKKGMKMTKEGMKKFGKMMKMRRSKKYSK